MFFLKTLIILLLLFVLLVRLSITLGFRESTYLKVLKQTLDEGGVISTSTLTMWRNILTSDIENSMFHFKLDVTGNWALMRALSKAANASDETNFIANMRGVINSFVKVENQN